MNFLAALHEQTHQTVHIDGRSIVLSRRPVGEHYRLRDCGRKLESEDPLEHLQAVFDYLEIAGIPQPEQILAADLASVLNTAIEINERIDLLPWQTTYLTESGKTKNTDYDNRELAIIIHTLAEAYHWSPETILNLPPEIAACYVQEIMLSEWRDREFSYTLSEAAYDEKGKYRPYPRLPWVVEIAGPSEKEARGPVKRSMLPDGVVIDYEKEQNEIKANQDQ